MPKKPKTGGSLTKETRKKMPPRGKARRTLYLEALMKELDVDKPELAEEEYYQFCIKVGMGKHQYFEETKEGREVVFGKPDNQMLKDGMARLFPQVKSTLPTYDFTMPTGKNVSKVQQGNAVLEAIGNKELPIDAGKLLIDIIKDVSVIEEIHEHGARLDALESMTGKNV